MSRSVLSLLRTSSHLRGTLHEYYPFRLSFRPALPAAPSLDLRPEELSTSPLSGLGLARRLPFWASRRLKTSGRLLPDDSLLCSSFEGPDLGDDSRLGISPSEAIPLDLPVLREVFLLDHDHSCKDLPRRDLLRDRFTELKGDPVGERVDLRPERGHAEGN